MSSTLARSACSRVSRPNISRRAGSVFGTSSSRKRATSSITSTSRVMSRARQVGTTTFSPSRSKPSRPSRWYCALGRRLDRRSARRRARGGSGRPDARGASRGRRSAPSSAPPASSSMSRVARSRRARRGTGRRPSPSGSSPRCAAAGARTSGRCRAARSSPPRAGRRRAVADLRLLAAHDPGERDRPLRVGDHRSSSTSSRSTPSSVRSRSPGSRARTTICPPASFGKSNACSGLPSASIT